MRFVMQRHHVRWLGSAVILRDLGKWLWWQRYTSRSLCKGQACNLNCVSLIHFISQQSGGRALLTFSLSFSACECAVLYPNLLLALLPFCLLSSVFSPSFPLLTLLFQLSSAPFLTYIFFSIWCVLHNFSVSFQHCCFPTFYALSYFLFPDCITQQSPQTVPCLISYEMPRFALDCVSTRG